MEYSFGIPFAVNLNFMYIFNYKSKAQTQPAVGQVGDQEKSTTAICRHILCSHAHALPYTSRDIT